MILNFISDGIMPEKSLKESKTYENLKTGFQGESMANRRYLYYARLAEKLGLNEIAEIFNKTANADMHSDI